MFQPAQIVELIRIHRERGASERNSWDRWHAWYLSEFWSSTANGADAPSGAAENTEQISLETNYPYPYLDTMTASVCPTNPLLSIKPREPQMAEAAKGREALVNDSFKRDKLHAKSWDLCTHAGIAGRGFSKTVWDARRRCPTTLICDPRTIFYDMTQYDWELVRYVCEAVVLTAEEFNARIRTETDPEGAPKYDPAVASKAGPDAYPAWLDDKQRSKATVNQATRELFQWYVVYEFYDLTADRFYHFLDGNTTPLFSGPLPNRFVRNPFSKIVFNSNLRDNGGVSDIKLIAPLQERLNELDSLELWFAKACVPIPILNDGAMDNPADAQDALQAAANPGDSVRLQLKNGKTFDDAIGYTKVPQLAPQHERMRDRCTQVIEFILGLPQYARGSVGKGGDTATEFALADAALRTRNGRRIKVVEDWISEVGRKVLGIWKEKLDPEQQVSIPRPYAGDDVLISRATLAFPTPGVQEIDEFEDEYLYNYEVVPYSPTENSKLVILQKLQTFWPAIQPLLGQGIDAQKFVKKFLELLGLDDLDDGKPSAIPAPAPSVAGAQGGGGADTIATGAPPPGTEDVETTLPADARQFASQPRL